MAQERCNLDKDEAEMLRPPSPSSSSAPQPAVAPPSTLFLIPPQKRPRQRAESPGARPKEDATRYADATTTETTGLEAPGAEHAASSSPVTRAVNRCWACKKRVGLTGFRCRCGDLFCPRHRYSDAHSCSFDYKAAGREEIAKANPVIRVAKIIKI